MSLSARAATLAVAQAVYRLRREGANPRRARAVGDALLAQEEAWRATALAGVRVDDDSVALRRRVAWVVARRYERRCYESAGIGRFSAASAGRTIAGTGTAARRVRGGTTIQRPSLLRSAAVGGRPDGMDVLDLGDPEQWPDGPRAVVEEIAARVVPLIEAAVAAEEPLDPDEWGEPDQDSGYAACDLPHLDYDFADEAEQRLRAALGSDRLLAARHATRLLPHEEDWIRSCGLRLLTENLVDEKLRRATEACAGLLSADEVELLRHSGQFEGGHRSVKRAGRLWVSAPVRVKRARRITPLIGGWGGEAIGWTRRGSTAETVLARLTTRSVPALVEVAVTVGDVPRHKKLWPVAVGSLLGLPEVDTDWGLKEPLGPERITGILRPGDPGWPDVLPAT